MIRNGVKSNDLMADMEFYDQSHFINTFRKGHGYYTRLLLWITRNKIILKTLHNL